VALQDAPLFAWPKNLLWFTERRAHYGESNPLGDIPDDGEGKSEEGEEIDLDGLLQ
jgi:hypothetical protein